MRKPKITAGWVALAAATVSIGLVSAIIGLASTARAQAAPARGSAASLHSGMPAPLGTLTVAPASGTVSQNPMFTSATTSAACPTGYGTNATLAVRPVGATTLSPLRPIGSDNTYDQAVFSLAPTRSMAVALFGPSGGTVAPGNYELAVLCTGEVLGDNPDLFVTPIAVTGDGWAVSDAPPATAPGLGGTVRIEADVAAGPSTSTTTSTAPPPGGGGGLPITGAALGMAVLGGLLLFGGGTGLVVAARRRRDARL